MSAFTVYGPTSWVDSTVENQSSEPTVLATVSRSTDVIVFGPTIAWSRYEIGSIVIVIGRRPAGDGWSAVPTSSETSAAAILLSPSLRDHPKKS